MPQIDVLREFNELHRRRREEDSQLNARIASFELAFRMQAQAPEAFDVSSETALTRRLYGIERTSRKPTFAEPVPISAFPRLPTR